MKSPSLLTQAIVPSSEVEDAAFQDALRLSEGLFAHQIEGVAFLLARQRSSAGVVPHGFLYHLSPAGSGHFGDFTEGIHFDDSLENWIRLIVLPQIHQALRVGVFSLRVVGHHARRLVPNHWQPDHESQPLGITHRHPAGTRPAA